MNIEEVINNLKKYISFSEKECNFPSIFDWNWHMELANDIETLLTAYEKEKEKNKELEDTLKCTQDSWFEDTQKIEEMKKQLDLDNECEIALNSKVMDLEKEIEELKDDRKKYAEEYIHNNPWLYKQLNENYILRVESEQRERKAYIKGTNDADELCNKKWENKIKAKIEEVHYKMIGHQDLREAVKQVLNSLLEKE